MRRIFLCRSRYRLKPAQRTYLAVVRGNIKTDSGVIETLIARDKNDRKKMAVVKEGGRDAVTEYEVLERFGKYTIVRCRLRTGRTHQIRVHMEYLAILWLVTQNILR